MDGINTNADVAHKAQDVEHFLDLVEEIPNSHPVISEAEDHNDLDLVDDFLNEVDSSSKSKKFYHFID